jgi:hypothetical protein
MKAVPLPPGASTSVAWSINNTGAVAGDAYYPLTSTRRAFANLGGGSVDLGTLGDSYATSDALAVNNSNLVVGSSLATGTDKHGFLWETNVLYDLNWLIPTNSGWSITQCNAINDAGQIAGAGRFGPVDRNEYAVLLNPLVTLPQANQPPTVSVVAPTNGSVFPSGTTVSLTAGAMDQDGFVTNVAFFAGSQWLGSATNPPPFMLGWSNAQPGFYQLTAVARDNLGASQTSGPISVEVRAPYPGAPRVALLSPTGANQNADIRKKLLNTLLFSSVEVIPASATDPVPTLAQLLQYDALLVYSFPAFNDPAALGDMLADFEDAGRGIVLALYATDTAKSPLGGRLQAQNYLPWAESGDNFGDSLTLVKSLPQHPILAGVQTFNGGQLSYYQQNAPLFPGSVHVAAWSNGQTLVAARQVGAGRLVGLNFFPVSSDVYSGWWVSSTDGAKLIGNALVWAAGKPPETAWLSTPSGVTNYLPGQDITLSVNLTNFSSPPLEVDIFTNNILLVSMTNAPFSFTWPHPAVGDYLATALVSDSQTNLLGTRPLALSVDSRLTISLTSPTNGALIYYPTNVPLRVAVADLDASVLYVDYYIDGTQFLARSSNAPYGVDWNVGVVGTFPMTAVATDAVGSHHTSLPNTITVIQYDPNRPVQTAWAITNGDWQVLTNWSNGIPRPQDTAMIDNGGTAQLIAGVGTATNLTIGLNSTGAVAQTGGDLTIGRTLSLGQNAGSAGVYELDGTGRLFAGQVMLGSVGAGHFVQRGGTVQLTNYLNMAGNSGGQSLYELFDGLLSSPSEYVASSQGGVFNQYGGTNAVQGLVVGANQASVTGSYHIEGGLLQAVDESVDATYPLVASMAQSGGSNQVSHILNVGDQGQGQLVVSGGAIAAAQLVIGVGGSLDITVGGLWSGIQVAGMAQFNSSLLVHLAPGYTPTVGDVWPVVSYGSYQGTFSRVTLPPTTNGIAWQLSYLTNQLVLRAVKLPNLIVVSPITATAETNLYYEIVQVSNLSAEPWSGARLFIPGLPAGTEVYNAAGSDGGVPYVEYDSPIPPGQTIQFYVQYFTRTTLSLVKPGMIFGALRTNDLVIPPGAPLTIDQATPRADGALVLGFNAEPNLTYYVEYSSDMTSWQTVPVPIIGVGSHVEWTDDGPPKTDSPPQGRATRFYRVTRSP